MKGGLVSSGKRTYEKPSRVLETLLASDWYI